MGIIALGVPLWLGIVLFGVGLRLLAREFDLSRPMWSGCAVLVSGMALSLATRWALRRAFARMARRGVTLTEEATMICMIVPVVPVTYLLFAWLFIVGPPLHTQVGSGRWWLDLGQFFGLMTAFWTVALGVCLLAGRLGAEKRQA